MQHKDEAEEWSLKRSKSSLLLCLAWSRSAEINSADEEQ